MENIFFNTSFGNFLGQSDGNVSRITGIPYAKAGRFTKPEIQTVYHDTIDGTNLSPAPPQLISPVLEQVLGVDIGKGLHAEENCLHLSITLPTSATSRSRLPVMIWIYGGSYTSGAGDALVYDPQALVSEQDVIVVSINYRLGILGFLGGYKNRPANLGLLDIITAIRWTKAHIADFGGDADGITLFGQSAGGDAIAHLLMADGIDGLFQNVIIQSAPLGIRQHRQKMTSKMMELASSLPDHASVDEILHTQQEIIMQIRKYGLKGGMPFGVQYGHYPLPEEKDSIKIWRERASRFNILIGSAKEETSLFAPFIPIVQKIKKWPLLGNKFVKSLIHKTTRTIYGKPAADFAIDMATHGGNEFQYEISWGAKDGFGATHTIDIPLLFGNQKIWEKAQLLAGIPWKEIDKSGRQIRSIWAQFAKTGSLKQSENIPGLIRYRKVK